MSIPPRANLLSELVCCVQRFMVKMKKQEGASGRSVISAISKQAHEHDDCLQYAPEIIAQLGRVRCNKCEHVDYLIQEGSHCYNLVCNQCGNNDWQILVSVHR